MKVLIIEDEVPARARLTQMLLRIEPSTEVVASLGSVRDTKEWLKHNSGPDIAFVDIHLSDDHSFEIFRESEIRFPIVFTTAYDQYLLESLEYNSIDYLLKPISEDKLRRALKKVKNLQEHFLQNQYKAVQVLREQGKRAMRIVAKKGADFIALNFEEIAYFYTEHKVVFVKDFAGRLMIVDHTLAELEQMIDTSLFFRINRKYIASMKAIEKFRPDNGKILLTLTPAVKEDVHVSKETAPLFREWVGKKTRAKASVNV